ncbi:phenylacetate--CoA ligase family protein [Halobacillus sp. Marseille-Q1614]|uniref:phenylacetate--CoA ligase family protein n=1 Tax=Halobacillus sp. Marseille-Q1614 TaxID=2709134 RepID=UPI00156D7DB8|nr:phenylacetate--CoA ligase family protein [Halobacillus sp. Marseille-Q1614]
MRKALFKITQRVKNGRVFEKIANMEELYGVAGEKEQEKKFTTLLKHAIDTTDYYKSYAKYKSIEECPVIEKKVIKENYNEFLSNDFKQDELIPMTTSGSYGTPFTFYLTKEKKEMQHAEVTFFSRWANFDIGVKHGYVASKIKSKKDQFIQNQLSIAPFVISEDWLSNEMEKIVSKKIKVLIGYPSAIGAIAKFFVSKNKFYKLDGVITISEILTEDVRLNVKKAFGVTPISRYSTEELGVLGIECKKNQKHHLNNINYIIEILDEHDNPVKPGETGRVVVTDLYSYAMPLIRYDTGDLAVLGKGNCNCGLETPYLERLTGRKLEVLYNTDGTPVASMGLNGKMRDIENILQFQIIQVGEKDYKINLVAMKGFSEEKEIIRRYKELFGYDSNIKVEYLEDIPPLKSGKRPYILQKHY